MEDLMDIDQIVDDKGWQLIMDSTEGHSNSSMLPLDAEALRVFDDEEGGWSTKPNTSRARYIQS
jgi:hypothetical protein